MGAPLGSLKPSHELTDAQQRRADVRLVHGPPPLPRWIRFGTRMAVVTASLSAAFMWRDSWVPS
ncbi:hypothetical protein MNEG_12889, partial [Monoraphidium neglectum]